ncbi:chromosome condensation complex Condensin, subunit G [Thecaphora frezii]
MPAAVAATRSARASASEQPTKPQHASTTPPPPPTTATNTTLLALPASIPPHFQEAQHSLANHRKNIVALHRIHQKASTITERTPKGTRLIGEKAFNEVFFGCLDRVLHIKKGVTNADRICKFVAAYATYAQEQFRLAARASKGGEPEEDEEEEDTPATRFTSLLLKHLLKGFGAKDKNVRLRCCGSVALLINGLESLDENLFQTLKSFLLARARDKDNGVRVQAVVALAKLQASEEDGDENAQDDGDDVRQVLVDILRYDPSAEVRRAALFNLTPSVETQPYIMERLRDIDAINRRCVYLGPLTMILPAHLKAMERSGASGPSRNGLDVSMVDEVICAGLGDREPSVKRAVKKLLNTWFDASGGDLIRFLSVFDVTTNPQVEAALQTILESRPALANQITFEAEQFWEQLTPTTALLARATIDYFRKTRNERRLEECLPLVTALAFRIQKEYNDLVELVERQQPLKDEEEEEMSDEQLTIAATIQTKTFTVKQLLGIALSSDYGDEIGRRKMFGLVRDMISYTRLPEELVASCFDVLRKLSNGQTDFMRMIVEMVQVLGGDGEDESEEDNDDDDDEEEELEDAMDVDGEGDGATAAYGRRRKAGKRRSKGGSKEPSADETALDSRKLLLIRAMLERVVGELQDNPAVHGLVPQLIAPAVKSKNGTVREQGLTCLALCCLLDRKLAIDTFPLFFDQVQKGTDKIRLCSVRAIFDLLVVHTLAYLCSRREGEEETAKKQIVTYLLSLLEDDDAAVQSAACEGMAKLMLTGMVEDDEALKSLVLVYMSPDTMENQELRQCLSYFIPVYCLSSSANQRRLQRVFVFVFQVLSELYLEKDAEQDMVTPLQVGLQLLEWSDPERMMGSSSASSFGGGRDPTVHVDVGIELLKAMLKVEERDERKIMCQLLAKLWLPDELDKARIKTVLALAKVVKVVKPLEDGAMRNAFARFEAAWCKAYPEQVERGVEREWMESEEAKELRAFFEASNVDWQVGWKGEKGKEGAHNNEQQARRSREAHAQQAEEEETEQEDKEAGADEEEDADEAERAEEEEDEEEEEEEE